MFDLYKHHTDMLSIAPLPQYSASEIKALAKEAENNNPVAQYNLGVFYAIGHGVENDYALYDKWMKRSAKLGDSEAQFQLGDNCYCDQDYKQAFHWFSKAADKEHAESISQLGTMYFRGEHVNKDYKKAFYLFTKSMCRDSSHDQYFLGYLYKNGLGVGQSDKEAIRWYQYSVDQNNSSAKNHLGAMYLLGDGIAKDQKKGFELISESAEQMNIEGCCSLGLMYAKGIYVEQDYQIAEEYLLNTNDYGDYCDCKSYIEIMKKINSALKKQRGKS